MYILGISCHYHDASATLLKDGEIVAAAEEERFSRKKHDASFPAKAIEFCLDFENISIQDIDYIAFYEKPILKFERILFQHLETFPLSYRSFIKSMPLQLGQKIRIQREIRKRLKYKKDIFFVPHHKAHAASAFLASPFKTAAVIVVDGVGEWATVSYGVGSENKITLQKEIVFPHSIGLLYSTITAYLGFRVNNSEYEVMGLSSYGDSNRVTNLYYKKLLKVINLKKDGSFCLDMSYFSYHYSDIMPSKKLCELLGDPVKKDNVYNKRDKDIAAALQLVTEDVLTRIVQHVQKETGCSNLALSGGVALNGVFNGKILTNSSFEKVWIQPNASDGGTSMGAALFAYNSILRNKRKYVFENPYLGPSFTGKEIKEFFKKNRIKYTELNDFKEVAAQTAQLLVDNNIVAWFQGRMEWGPRALGARSILANPKNPNARDILNEKIKHRDTFRPFAPAILEKDFYNFFDYKKDLQEPMHYMLMVFPFLKKWHKKISSVCHIDGTGRPQLVRKKTNPLFYDLLEKFGKTTGVPMLINTSFNVRSEPIVCTPEDAFRCIMNTEIDYLVIDRFVVARRDNLGERGRKIKK